MISAGSCSERGSVGVYAGRSAGLAHKQGRTVCWGRVRSVYVCVKVLFVPDRTSTRDICNPLEQLMINVRNERGQLLKDRFSEVGLKVGGMLPERCSVTALCN